MLPSDGQCSVISKAITEARDTTEPDFVCKKK